MTLSLYKQPTTVVLSGNPVVFSLGSNTVTLTNHKIHIEIYRLIDNWSSVLVGEESLPVISGSTCLFDLSDYLKYETLLNITVLDLFDIIPQSLNSNKRYIFKIFESYNNDGIKHNYFTTSQIWAVNGGFSKLFLKNYLAIYKDFFTDFISTDKKFLSWAPDKNICWNQHDILFFMGLETVKYYYKITLTFSDNSTQVIDSAESYCAINQLSWLNSSYLSNSLDAYETEDKIIKSYTIQVFNASDVAVTEIKTYYLDRNTYNFSRQFIFRNSFGAYDIIMLKGISEQSNEIQRTVGYFQTKDATSFSEYSQNYKAASGFLVTNYTDLSAAQQYITELFNSKEIYEIVGSEIVPVIQSNNKIKINQDNEFLFSFNFEYAYAQSDSYFSPLDREQYLNPRIFYRNGDIDDVAPTQTATVDFDIWINENATVTFTLDWGAAIGTTYITSEVLTADVVKSLTSSITIPGNITGEQLLTITDSLGGKYYIPYLVNDTVMLFNDGVEMQFNDGEQMLYNS